jgi:hypothetical protein
VIELALAILLTTADAALISLAQQSAPIAAGMYRVGKISGDGRDWSIDSVEPRVIHVRGVAPQKLTVTVKGTRNRSDRTIVIGGANGAVCQDGATTDTYSCVITWTDASRWWLQGEWLRFNVVSTRKGAPVGAPPLSSKRYQLLGGIADLPCPDEKAACARRR